jgi:DNA polymerase I
MPQELLDLERLVPSAHDGLTAVEVNRDGTATLFSRCSEESAVESHRIAFQPWLLTAERALADRLGSATSIIPLAGNAALRFRVHFQNLHDYQDAVSFLKKETRRNPSDPAAPYKLFSDFEQQLLSTLPARLFRGMTFECLRRLQLDIETLTSPGFDFPNAERPGDEVIIISLRDSTGWEECLSGEEYDEKGLLTRLVEVVRERDPDVIEGHNIFGFDLPYIEQRCKRHGVRLKLGRDGSVMHGRPSRFTSGERTSAYTRYTVYGRHIVDTLHLVQLYDVIHRDLESYNLKEVAIHFGLAAADRTYVEGAEISDLWRRDPAQLCRYAMDDVRETAAIAALLSPSYFHQAQLVPFSYQNCVTRGSAARIDAMLIAAYMERQAALPKPLPARPFRGGLTESQKSGVFRNVWHVDVRSLYPSIMVTAGTRPVQDACDIFLTYLRELRRFRLEVKDASRQAADRVARDRYEALQSTFKILINSFYGYLGFSQATFNDFDLAESVTATGRQILSDMVDFLGKRGAQVIELDTDGIYFVPPADVDDTVATEAEIQGILPAGIEVDLDATYAAMFSYKSKNYALLAHDGQVSITGAALKSRGLEPFQRRYIHDLISMLLTGRSSEIPALYKQYEQDIREHRLPLADIAKREVLSAAPATYAVKLKAGATRRSAAYELALASPREYGQGDQVAFYVTGSKRNVAVTDNARLLADARPGERDENIAYYLDKLAKLHAKFEEFIPSRVEPHATLPGL